jgi:GTP-binding protein EngB required for normal cell division
MTVTVPSAQPASPESLESVPGLPERLRALDSLVELGTGRIDQQLLDDAATLLGQAGQRLKLSPDHTVVALAGGTGGGKSSLFNSVCGVDLSPVGVKRPTTARTHACVWGLDGAGPLLDWLGVDKRQRYARASANDPRGISLQGLVLLDLPDHDTIRSGHTVEVERFVGVADLLVWVVDPQKYADASLHHRFITPLAGHAGVTLVVLNQVDKLQRTEAAEIVHDLRHLLAAEGMQDPYVITTSTTAGDGIDGLMKILSDAVAARGARVERLASDIDRLTERFTAYCDAAEPVTVFGDQRVEQLTDALTDAAGVPAVAESMQSAYELRATDYIGWPVTGLTGMFRRDPLRRMRLSELQRELRQSFTGPAGAQQADIDNALEKVAEGAATGLPAPWPEKVRTATLSHAEKLSSDLNDALSEIVPRFTKLPGWWWAVRIWQMLLAGIAIVTLGWLAVLGVFTVLENTDPPAAFLGNTALVPYVLLLFACMLGMGALTASAGRNMVTLSAVRHGEQMQERMRERVADVARQRVIEPAERELGVYALFRRLVRELTR